MEHTSVHTLQIMFEKSKVKEIAREYWEPDNPNYDATLVISAQYVLSEQVDFEQVWADTTR
eukprot:COSAG01_NODE_23442_length_815_cov_1.081006_1_plen_60_part_10